MVYTRLTGWTAADSLSLTAVEIGIDLPTPACAVMTVQTLQRLPCCGVDPTPSFSELLRHFKLASLRRTAVSG